jgi:hypothetical protein
LFESKTCMTLLNRKSIWVLLLALAITSAGTAL